MNTIKMIATFIVGGILSYFTIRVFAHYLGKNEIFDLRNPAEFIIVFSTFVFYVLFSYKTLNELQEAVVEEPTEKPIKNIPFNRGEYASYEEIRRN